MRCVKRRRYVCVYKGVGGGRGGGRDLTGGGGGGGAEISDDALKIKRPRPRETLSESRQGQEEGGELDSHEEASPEEIKRREVELG